ncbi:MAG: protoporphyrinogen oxidase HemJ [Alphaproteobacteria bacterium]|nr:protoporphyrinogen oxidase HemJ [Alphaproteobacteria bacterium]
MEWVRAVHVIAVIAWMAGLLYLPRLFVYHAGSGADTVLSETFKIMERRLYRAIMTPAMVASWVLGLWLIAGGSVYFGEPWVWAKGTLVVALTGYHFWLGVLAKHFARDDNGHSARFFRWINEVPTVLMIGIVLLVIGKPGFGV